MEEKDNLTQNSQNSGGAWLFFWDLAKVFLIAFGLVSLVIRPFLLEPFIVSGSSMVPNYHNRDYLIVEKLSYRQHEPERGDVIVFKYPLDQKQYFIKRVIGLPGDTVRIQDGKVFLADRNLTSEKQVPEEFLPQGTITYASGNTSIWTVGQDQYFVLGDNRGASSDSRVWGLLPKSMIVGKAWLRILPLSDAQLLGHAEINIE